MRSWRVPKALRPLRAVAAAAIVAVVCGCASGPGRNPERTPPGDAGAAPRGVDGPGADPPPDLAGRADAEPRIEPIRGGGANKPYEVLGRSYVPATKDLPYRERGLASWYGRKFHGRKTASGEIYDMYAMTAAHPTLPIPSYARIRNPANGREVLVRINDRGPFVAGRIVDLSYTAALKLDLLRGVAPVELERITFDDIRTGAWRGAPRDRVEPAPVLATAPPVAAPATTVPAQDTALVVATPAPPATTPTATTTGATTMAAEAGAFWVPLAAFRPRDGAAPFRRRVGDDADSAWLEPLLTIFADSALYRVQAGPYRSRDDAESAAQRARTALQIVPVVVERR